MQIWGLSSSATIVYQSVQFPTGAVTNVITMQERIMVAINNGTTELLQWDKEAKKLYFLLHNNDHDHENQVTGIDIYEKEKLWLSTSEDGTIKLWNWDKLLIREIKFPHPLNSGVILNSHLDILIGFENMIYVCRAKKYRPKAIQIQDSFADQESIIYIYIYII